MCRVTTHLPTGVVEAAGNAQPPQEIKCFRISRLSMEAPGFGLAEHTQSQQLTVKDVVSILSILSNGPGRVQNRYSGLWPRRAREQM